MTREEFIKRANESHQIKYDYSLIPEKIVSKDKAKIICSEHGVFECRVDMFLRCYNCYKCSCNLRTKSTEQFIQEAQKIHDLKYDYSKVKYINSTEKVKIICSEHGEFEQTPNLHLRGSGCPICGRIQLSNTQAWTQEQFIQEAQKIHGSKYNYSKVKYINMNTLVKIICSEHGKFEILPQVHLKGSGCPYCSGHKLNKEIFIQKAQKIHGLKYDYSKVNYVNNFTNVKIICSEHGEFEQLPHNHLSGKGCPKCSFINGSSKSEKELLEFIKQLLPDKKIIENYRDNNFEIDIYIPELNIGIEYNGLYWHSEEFKSNNYHLDKTNYFENKNIQIIHIFENEWILQQKIIKSRLTQILGCTKYKIGARKCYIKQVSNKETKIFLQNNHLQGYINSSINYGLYWKSPVNNKEYLVSLMTFGPLRKNLGSINQEGYYELYRFVNACNFTIVGGASKLFKHFIKQHNPQEIISYANRRFTTMVKNSVYTNIGMEFDSFTNPNYFYIEGLKLHNRFSFRKDILVNKYGCKHEMTEKEFMRTIMKMPRIYDCGNIKYVWKH